MNKFNISVLAAAAVVCAASAFAQAPAIQPVMMKQLKPDVWVGLGGSGGNSTIYIGKTGVIVVDASARFFEYLTPETPCPPSAAKRLPLGPAGLAT